MIKFNDKTRIKVSGDIKKELNLNYWNNAGMYYIMKFKYGLEFTSKRIVTFYFRIVDKQKFLLFSIEHGNYILKK